MVKRNSIILLVRNYYVGSEYLVYEDKGWNTLFFPHITDHGQTNEELEQEIARIFDAPLLRVKAKYLSTFNEQKPCVEHGNEMRDYTYKIYEVEIGNGSLHRLNVFQYNGLNYRWENLKKLKKDKNVLNCNTGLLSHIEKLDKQYWEGITND